MHAYCQIAVRGSLPFGNVLLRVVISYQFAMVLRGGLKTGEINWVYTGAVPRINASDSVRFGCILGPMS